MFDSRKKAAKYSITWNKVHMYLRYKIIVQKFAQLNFEISNHWKPGNETIL